MSEHDADEREDGAEPVAAPPAELSAEDAKLVTLARGARGRVGAIEGAAIRDETGRTYSGATVALPTLALSALRLAVAVASASGARGVEAAVVVRRAPGIGSGDVAAVRDLGGAGVPILLVGPDGRPLGSLLT